MKESNPKRFLDAAEEIYHDAKIATIELLKAQGEKCFVVNIEECEHQVYTWDDRFIEFKAVGLENGRLIIGGTHIYPGGGESLWEYDPDFQDTDLYSFSYPDLYDFVASNLPENAVTREEAEKMLNDYQDE